MTIGDVVGAGQAVLNGDFKKAGGLLALAVVKPAKIAKKGGEIIGGAKSAVSRVKLQKQLASEQQLGELAKTTNVMAGAGAKTPINDINRIVGTHGGSAGDWQKVKSSNFRAADGVGFQTHAYRNPVIGKVVEAKTKFNN